ncbi:MAG: hypothetical protein JWQ91_2953 [Aeromicrobium sp.]|jgi:hypothetical protein|nr:hypothetical protein [Aeromicrobium sp.]MCW2826036.1 hypothetical protein [Aeromicrobium sp.]
MRTVGWITSSIGAIIAVGAVVVAAMSLPDIKRYLKMRQM